MDSGRVIEGDVIVLGGENFRKWLQVVGWAEGQYSLSTLEHCGEGWHAR